MVDVVAMEDVDSFVGRIVWWRLDGLVHYETLSESWEDAGLDMGLLPARPSKERALQRTLLTWAGRRRIVRPLGHEVRGYALVRETADKSELAHRALCRAWFEPRPNSEDELVVVSEESHFDRVIRNEYWKRIGELDTRAISVWLGKLILKTDAVTLSPKKGFYFVPREQIATWDSYVAALADSSDHKVYGIPAVRAEDAVESIVDAITHETSVTLHEINEELEDELEPLKPRAMRTRIAALERSLAKLGRYEDLLGTKFDTVKAQVDELAAELAATYLVATGTNTNE
jgi:hypothetical protein